MEGEIERALEEAAVSGDEADAGQADITDSQVPVALRLNSYAYFLKRETIRNTYNSYS